VNFAGNYRVVLWGCGTSCESGAIVDAATGRVYDLPMSLEVGAQYRVDSRLFVADPSDEIRAVYGDDPPARLHPTYYLWADTGLVPLGNKQAP
jgi:hypothetical protein